MVYNFFDKKTLGSAFRSKTLVTQNKSAIMTSQELAEELHKPIIRKFEKWKVYSSFIGNSWGADIVDMQLISKFN